MPYKVEYNPSGYGNLYNVDAWKSDADKNLYRQSAEYDELNYVPKVSGLMVHDGKACMLVMPCLSSLWWCYYLMSVKGNSQNASTESVTVE